MRITRIMQSMLLGVLILTAGTKNSDAFFLMPPMPWDIEVDFPGDATKIVSNIKAQLRQLQTIKTELASQKLEIVKAGQKYLSEISGGEFEDGNKNKTPGKGVIKNDTTLGITQEGLDEKEVFNAMFRLFFIYPEIKDDIPFPVLQTAYRRKAIEYTQDVVMETYLTGRVTEEYLSVVENTIDRLDKCQKMIYSESEMTKNCTFFGLTMAYVDKDAINEGNADESDEPGQIGGDKNAYIVTVVYDRLMRIVENLTAVEAQFQATKQIEMVDPVVENEEAQSSAADYIEPAYEFAYNNSYELTNAAYLISKKERGTCDSQKDVNCPAVNSSSTDMLDIEDTGIFRELQLVDNNIDEAVRLHNAKSRLWEYKSLYRKYLKAKEIHEKLFKVLQQSDTCAVNFITKYLNQTETKTKTPVELWGAPSEQKANMHNLRSGYSRELLEEYQKYVTETILGVSEACEGYYETCPSGQVRNETDTCPTDSKKYKCVEVIDTVTYDTEKGYGGGDSMTASTDPAKAFPVDENSVNDTDYLTDGTKAEEQENENRKKAERTWLIGHNLVDKLTKEGTLVFHPWNDQKNLQYEYLRNKYRNIRMIIKSVDQGQVGYRVASVLANSDTSGKDSAMSEVFRKLTTCKMPSMAITDAHEDFCSDFLYEEKLGTYYKTDSDGNKLKCTISANNDTGYINALKEEYYWDDNGQKETRIVSKIYDQRIHDASTGGKLCDIETPPVDAEEYFEKLQAKKDADNASCHDMWDFTVNFLVKNYMPAVLGQCGADMDAQTQNLYKSAKDMGREVAVDKLSDALNARVDSEKTLSKLAVEYNGEITELRNELKTWIERQATYKDKVNIYTKQKNNAIQQQERSKQRVEAINQEIEGLKARKENELVANLTADKEAIDQQIKNLEEEKKYLNGNAVTNWDNLPTSYQTVITADEAQKQLQLGSCPYVKDDKDSEGIELPDSYFMTINECSTKISKLKPLIESAQKSLDVIQEQIIKYTGDDENLGLIKEKAEEFANEYITQSKIEQEKIEDENSEFENMVVKKKNGENPDRMINQQEEYCCKKIGICIKYCTGVKYASDNLQTTIVHGLYRTKKGPLLDIIKDTMNDQWFSSDAINKLLKTLENGKINLPEKFVLADNDAVKYLLSGLDVSIDLNKGLHTPKDLIKAIKDGMVEEAAKKVEEHITNADEIVKTEIDAAANEVDTLTKELKVSGETASEASELDTPNIYDRANYGAYNKAERLEQVNLDQWAALQQESNAAEEQETTTDDVVKIKEITQMHYSLIDNLKTPTFKNADTLNEAGIDLRTLFGIPEYCNENGENCTLYKEDNDYFVALPARGVNNKVNEEDEGNGRDYLAPHEPLMNIAPLRESFYFSPLDYDDTPKKGSAPAISQLLNYKYADEPVEYLPEVWRYLLARPNLRNDGKYQQTFIERAYDAATLKKYINSFDSNHYRTLVSRAGVYPCTYNGRIIDAYAKNDEASNISFVYNKNTMDNLPACQEIELYKSTWVKHLLADFKPNLKDSKNPALQKNLGTSTELTYSNYSELGQFLQEDLKYRPLLKSINDYLLDKNNDDNSITRQRADTASFKRNVFGSFLEAVNAEYNAKKSMEQYEQEVKDSLNDLCQQIHSFGKNVNGECSEEESEECNSDESNDKCVNYIFNLTGTKAMASSSEDSNYTVQKCYPAPVSIFGQLFCDLDGYKETALAEAQKNYENIKSKYSETVLNKVKEQTQEIEDYLAAFNEDKDEVATMKPQATAKTQKEAVKEAEANNQAILAADEEAIISMGNQNQAVAYCPVYGN